MASTNELESPAGSSRRRRAASGGGSQGSAKRRRRRQGGPPSPASGGSASASAAAGSSSEQGANVNEELLLDCVNMQCSSSSSAVPLEVLQKMSMDRSAHEQLQEEASKKQREAFVALEARKVTLMEQEVELEEEMLQLRQEEEIHKVMFLDTEKLSPWVRDYYVAKQKKIAAEAGCEWSEEH